jgi:ribosome biogenesis GTPase / thiamine phosphate phosphatase
MPSNRRKSTREKDLTSRFLDGEYDEDRLDKSQKFTDRNKHAQQNKIERTAQKREGNQASIDIDALPIGQVIQVFSLYSFVEHPTGIRLCSIRKTLSKLSNTSIVVGDRVKFLDSGRFDEAGHPEAVIEQILPRQTLLVRAGSFLAHQQQPIVANAQQMLLVVSLMKPAVKWGLVDRMLVAAQAGGLSPVVCLNKVDLAESSESARRQLDRANEILSHYESMKIQTLRISASANLGIDSVVAALKNKSTVLTGHSGVGKSTVISAVEPGLDIRTAEVSHITEKGRHTTTSARVYRLKFGAEVIDTPGVRQFGLWNVTAENLMDYFPDIRSETAPPWRIESYQHIADSL